MNIKYSVIVLTYNQLDKTTRPCLESVLKYSPLDETEIIVVDNASKDGTRSYLRGLQDRYKQIRIIFNEENKGFSAGNNDGLRKAKGEFIVILNNDTLVTPDWLQKIVVPFEKELSVGLVGPVTNYAGTEQRIDIRGISEKNYLEKSQIYTFRQKNVKFSTSRLSFFCVATTSKVLKKIGYLDEEFTRGMFEDDDYCKRVQLAGYSIAVVEDCFIYHKGSISFNALEKKMYEDLFEKNRRIYEIKHKLVHFYTTEGLAYLKKITEDARLYQENPSDSLAIERVIVRLRSLSDFLQFLVTKEKELKKNNSVQISELIDQKKNITTWIRFELEKLTKFIEEKKSFVNNLTSYLNMYFESPMYSFWLKVDVIKKRFFDLKNIFFISKGKNPYKLITFYKPIQIDVIDQDFSSNRNRNFSVIITVLNEAKSIELLLSSIFDQALMPSEVIIIDGGSNDKTREIIKKSILHRKTKLRFYEGNYTIPEGRNLGVRLAKFDVIVTTDGGCILHPQFFQNITAPLFEDKEVDLVGGIYHSIHQKGTQYFIPHWKRNNWQLFLPSARAAAYRKKLIKKAGFFPEHLNVGEDTLFDISYRSISHKWVYNTSAYLYWKNPPDFDSYMKLARRYGFGDGQSGVGDWEFYTKMYQENNKKQDLKPFRDSFYIGYLEGRATRSQIEKQKLQLKQIILLFVQSLTPLSKSKWMHILKGINTSNAKTFVIFTEHRRFFRQEYLSITEARNVEIIFIDDFDMYDFVDRYHKQYSMIQILDLHPKRNEKAYKIQTRLSAFFNVTYRNI